MLEAQGAKEAAILRAEAEMKVLELQAEGEKKASTLRGEGEASRLNSLDTATINPRTLAVLQLRALQEIAASNNAKGSCLRGGQPDGVRRSALEHPQVGIVDSEAPEQTAGSHHPLHLTVAVHDHTSLSDLLGSGRWASRTAR